MSQFLEQTAVTPSAEGAWTAEIHRGWLIGSGEWRLRISAGGTCAINRAQPARPTHHQRFLFGALRAGPGADSGRVTLRDA